MEVELTHGELLDRDNKMRMIKTVKTVPVIKSIRHLEGVDRYRWAWGCTTLLFPCNGKDR